MIFLTELTEKIIRRLLDARSFNAVYVTQSGESNADGRDDFLG